ncbi:MAG: hypothetical protein ACNA7J_06510 [Wenzhouxiangella sp.]
MAARWRSRTGWTLVATYLLVAGVAWYEAFTCTGWACDLAAIPAFFPLGLPIASLTGWWTGEWYFIAPTVLANSLFYYWLGHLLDGLVNHLRRRYTASNHGNRP